MQTPEIPVPSEITGSEPVRTRYGRVSKPPVKYEPIEQVEDDYADEDYDSYESEDVSTTISTDTDEADDEDDADEYGNLDGFIVPDKNESDDSPIDGEPPVPVKKRPTAAPASTPAKTRGKRVAYTS